MESVIREGALRLQTAETTCDVILNCQGHRLMAHKLILSIASPILQNLLKDDTSTPSVVILPDINSNIMSLILDYIYTGSVIIYQKILPEFLGVCHLLKLHLDRDCLEKHFKNSVDELNYRDDFKLYKPEKMFKKKEEFSDNIDVVSPELHEIYSKKNLRKLPSLLPLNAINQREKSRKLCNYVIPSPWCPRVEAVLVDPRTDCMPTERQMSPRHQEKLDENDTNNNFTSSFPRYHIQETNLNVLPQQEANYSLPQRNNVFKPSTISSSRLGLNLSYNKIERIASKLEKQKSLEIAINEVTTKKPPLEVILPTNKNISKKEKLRSRSPKCISNDSSRDGFCLSSSNEDDEKGLESGEDGKIKKIKAFTCEDCGKGFSQIRNYKYHRSIHEGTKEFAAKCPECGKVFNDRGYLSSHMKIHRDRKEYACPHCPKRFNQRVAYNMHLRIHTGVKPHECPTCGKSFSRKMLLKQHQRVHTGERPYSCPECGKTFADRSNMSLHARLHTGVKPYACTLCPKSFTKKHHLKTHMNFHTGLKPYTCQKCGLAFSQSSNMRTHYKKCILKNNNPSQSQGNPTEQSTIPQT